MRVRSSAASLTIGPGEHADLTLDIVNTGGVIDGITARVVGLAESQVSSSPAVLPLFPDAAGRLTLTIGLPRSFPSGRHQLTVAVLSRQLGVPPEYVDLELVVPEVPSVALSSTPQVVRARRTGRFVVTVANRGNVGLDVNLAATDPERALGVVLKPAVLTVAPASGADVLVSVKAPRYVLGGDLDRPITLTASARPIGSLSAMPAVATADAAGTAGAAGPVASGPAALPGAAPDEPDPENHVENTATEPITASAPITLRHRPWVTRGVLTAAILLAIIAGWAAVFLFGIGQVFAGDPLTKSAPASFFASATLPGTGPSLAANASDAPGSVVGGTAGTAAEPAGEPPFGALPKTGTMPAGVGGTISGTIRAASDGSPVGRILVEAMRVTPAGGHPVIVSAATQEDGSYSIPGLFPGTYQLRLSGSGFGTQTIASRPRDPSSRAITVNAGAVTAGADAVIVGQVASIQGSVDSGTTVRPVISHIAIVAMSGPRAGRTVATVDDDATGKYVVGKLPAPGDYEIQVAADGFETSTVQTSVDAGAVRFQPAIPIAAAAGRIAGIVTSGGQPLGGVTITTTVNGKTITTGTPTTGAVGQFDIGQVPTPGTYVLTFSLGGYGSTTEVVDLTPGTKAVQQKVEMPKGTGSASGRLVGPTGAGLGGAVVTVGGMVDPPTTTTLTVGSVGSFALQGLPAPGLYTLTFTLAGYAPTTVPLTIGTTGAPPSLQVTMASALGEISGRVLDSSGQPIVDAAVRATDGSKVWTVTSTPASGTVPNGGYVIAQLPAGIYTVTATGSGGVARTVLVTVTAGATTAADVTLPGAG